MKKVYQAPAITKIEIDYRIAFLLQSGPSPVGEENVTEPGSGGSGIGGEGNGGGGGGGWERTEQNPYFEDTNNFDLILQ